MEAIHQSIRLGRIQVLIDAMLSHLFFCLHTCTPEQQNDTHHLLVQLWALEYLHDLLRLRLRPTQPRAANTRAHEDPPNNTGAL